jgi:copper chaperone CopZ
MNVCRPIRLLFPLLLFFFPAEASSSDDHDILTLNVEGMHCQSCVSMIKKTVRKVPGVESVAIDLEKGIVEVTGDSLVVRQAQIAGSIEKMGYDVLPTESAGSDSLKVKKQKQ